MSDRSAANAAASENQMKRNRRRYSYGQIQWDAQWGAWYWEIVMRGVRITSNRDRDFEESARAERSMKQWARKHLREALRSYN